MRLFSLLAVLPLVTLGAVAPELPPSEFADAEVSTNLPFAQPPANVGGMSLRLEFSGTPSNNVEVVLGTDADGEGAFLSLTTNLPPWIYSADWNTIRLTARGTDTLNESLSYAVTERGAVIILE